MRCLTVRQPYAGLISNGLKVWETRGWRTRYRGPLAIHAAGRPHQGAPPSLHALLDEQHYGMVLATCTLVACERTEDLLAAGVISARERAAGDWGPGRFAWHLADIRPLLVPVPAKGALGFWHWLPQSVGTALNAV